MGASSTQRCHARMDTAQSGGSTHSASKQAVRDNVVSTDVALPGAAAARNWALAALHNDSTYSSELWASGAAVLVQPGIPPLCLFVCVGEWAARPVMRLDPWASLYLHALHSPEHLHGRCCVSFATCAARPLARLELKEAKVVGAEAWCVKVKHHVAAAGVELACRRGARSCRSCGHLWCSRTAPWQLNLTKSQISSF
jgi:hypothetical protein